VEHLPVVIRFSLQADRPSELGFGFGSGLLLLHHSQFGLTTLGDPRLTLGISTQWQPASLRALCATFLRSVDGQVIHVGTQFQTKEFFKI